MSTKKGMMRIHDTCPLCGHGETYYIKRPSAEQERAKMAFDSLCGIPDIATRIRMAVEQMNNRLSQSLKPGTDWSPRTKKSTDENDETLDS